jgi:hypothetical protein
MKIYGDENSRFSYRDNDFHLLRHLWASAARDRLKRSEIPCPFRRDLAGLEGDFFCQSGLNNM